MVREPLEEAAAQLLAAAAAKKCWPCGCLHQSLAAIESGVPRGQRPSPLDEALDSARKQLREVRYECLGCDVCYPALAINALSPLIPALQAARCPTEAEAREGWPPLPGAYTVLRYHAPVAICTLTDEAVAAAIIAERPIEAAIVGTMQTENLGIERLVTNVLADPNIRFVVVCGSDSRQAVGHLPGQSLAALAHGGIDDGSRIIGAHGKRPVLRNLSRETVEHFRRTVEIVDLVGVTDVRTVLETVKTCADRDPGCAPPFSAQPLVTRIEGYVPDRVTQDPAGFFVLYPDRRRRVLSVEHYRNNGVLSAIVEGRTAAEIYWPLIEQGRISRLDHAVYLGRELARAEQALLTGEPYIQDAAAESAPASSPPTCGCSSTRAGEPPAD